MSADQATLEQWAALRLPFKPESIGKLPKGGIQLDYVGHAAVTDRLLEVDPLWTWEPLAVDAQGLPALDRAGNLWIKLTVLGHTRIGVGDGKSAKECTSDAIRNAAMRFGVALDLWSKEELESHIDAPELKNDKQAVAPTVEPVAPPPPKARLLISAEDVSELLQTAKHKGHTTREAAVKFLNDMALGDFTQLTIDELPNFRKVIAAYLPEVAA